VLPALPATVSADSSPAVLPAGGVAVVSPAALDELLGEAPLGAGGVPLSALEVPLLSKRLIALPGISTLKSVNGLGGTKGVEGAIVAALGELADERQSLAELVGEDELATDLEEQLEAVYEKSKFAKEHEEVEFEEAVEKALSKGPEEVIDEGLNTLSLSTLLSRLLAEAVHPAALIGAVFAAVEPEELEELLGTTVSDEPFTSTKVSPVAAELGVTPAELAEKLARQPAELPGTAIALLEPLTNGQVLGVFGAGDGLAFGLIGTRPVSEEPEPEPIGGSNPGASKTPALTTSTPAAVSPAPAPPVFTFGSAPAATAKLKILSHKVRGATVTLALQIPAAGKLTVRGPGVRSYRHTIARAEHVTIKLTASSAGAAALRRHHRLTVRLRASFRAASGASSTATVTVQLQ
jgi:hypothetical protein